MKQQIVKNSDIINEKYLSDRVIEYGWINEKRDKSRKDSLRFIRETVNEI